MPHLADAISPELACSEDRLHPCCKARFRRRVPVSEVHHGLRLRTGHTRAQPMHVADAVLHIGLVPRQHAIMPTHLSVLSSMFNCNCTLAGFTRTVICV